MKFRNMMDTLCMFSSYVSDNTDPRSIIPFKKNKSEFHQLIKKIIINLSTKKIYEYYSIHKLNSQ